MNELEKEFFAFLDTRKQQTLEEASALASDSRKDESNVLKAKANIYDIFKALWNASKKTTKDTESFKETLLKKMTVIPAQWEAALTAAKKNADAGKILIEEAKLSAVSEIMEKLHDLL